MVVVVVVENSVQMKKIGVHKKLHHDHFHTP